MDEITFFEAEGLVYERPIVVSAFSPSAGDCIVRLLGQRSGVLAREATAEPKGVAALMNWLAASKEASLTGQAPGPGYGVDPRRRREVWRTALGNLALSDSERLMLRRAAASTAWPLHLRLDSGGMATFRALFDAAQFVVVVSDGVGAVAENVSSGSSTEEFAGVCDDWASFVSEAIALSAQDDVVMIRLEDLVENPDTASATLFEALGLSTARNGSDEPESYLSSLCFQGSTNSTVDGDNQEVGATWSVEQRSLFEAKCGPSMAKLGYHAPSVEQ